MSELFSFSNPIIQLLTACLLGGFLGMRREIDTKRFTVNNEFMGFRSLSLIALVGTVSTFFPSLPYLPVVFFSALIILMTIAYYHGRFKLGIYGMTTELSSLCVFWIGVLLGQGPSGAFPAIIVTMFLAIINAYKYSLHDFIRTLTKTEWSGALQLGFISAIVLPLLPTVAIDPFGVFVPFKVWLLVVLISGIGFIGYFLVKYLGFRGGVPLIGFLGSITSSVAVTVSMSNQSKKFNFPNIFAGGVMIALATMQLRVVGVVFFLGTEALRLFLFIPALMSLVCYAFGFYYSFVLSKKSHSDKLDKNIMKLQSPFELGPALKFGVIFVSVLFALALGQKYLGESGVYVAAVLSGVVDVDAIVLSSLEALKLGELSTAVAKNSILLAVFVNTLTKSAFVYFLATRDLFYRVTIGVLAASLVGGIAFLFYLF
jgi:uncharacterized membrane protein (DUF4010 family)